MAEAKLWDRVKAVFAPQKTINVYGHKFSAEASYRVLYTHLYNGEKNMGEVGPIKLYGLEYNMLRARSWQSFLESEITQTIMGRYVTWVIGTGLKLQSEPKKSIFELEGIKLDSQKFSKTTESFFSVWRDSSCSDNADMESLDEQAAEAFKNAIVGGDCLVVLRYIEGVLKVQLIDGEWLEAPQYGTDAFPQTLANGHQIKNGIEQDKNGKHVSYWIREANLKFTNIPARSESGLQSAFLVTGLTYRLNNNRGIPLIAVVLEKLKKMERYSEATLGSAEERQKIAVSIEHELNANGENPFAKNLAKAWDATAEEVPQTIDGQILADNVTVTTNKQAINLPPGAKLNQLESKNELYFKDFYSVNIDLVCAALGIPPNVAMSKYDNNYSSSRAAIKDWENSLNVVRERFAKQFYKKIYAFWLDIKILENQIPAPGYLKARLTNNYDILGAYRSSRFVGAPVPHIDPVKEVEAIRLKLGTLGAHLPLINLEQATEELNGGDSAANLDQFGEELISAKENGLEPVEVSATPGPKPSTP